MKTILSLILGVFLFAGAQSVIASNIPMPDLPIGEKAFHIEKYDFPCGEVKEYLFLDW